MTATFILVGLIILSAAVDCGCAKIAEAIRYHALITSKEKSVRWHDEPTA